jgi:6-pyruvoyltetrahydropterin/6-carboxytetrahydropterin synthase
VLVLPVLNMVVSLIDHAFCAYKLSVSSFRPADNRRCGDSFVLYGDRFVLTGGCMYTITKQFHFSASHVLHGLPAEHQCGRLHGHNYIVEVVLHSADLNATSFVLDYGELKPFSRYLDTCLDHRHLNDVLPFQTSAEALARHFYDWCKARWPQTAAVRVSETPKTWAEYHE